MFMFIEYMFILKYALFCFIISCLLSIISFLLVYQKPELEKLSAYECGFNPFGDARNKFEVRFYLIGILFIIFDLELLFYFHELYLYMILVFMVFIQCLYLLLF